MRTRVCRGGGSDGIVVVVVNRREREKITHAKNVNACSVTNIKCKRKKVISYAQMEVKRVGRIGYNVLPLRMGRNYKEKERDG